MLYAVVDTFNFSVVSVVSTEEEAWKFVEKYLRDMFEPDDIEEELNLSKSGSHDAHVIVLELCRKKENK